MSIIATGIQTHAIVRFEHVNWAVVFLRARDCQLVRFVDKI